MPLKPDQVPDVGAVPTASETVLRYLRDAIVDGTLNEGEPVRQDEVARLFNVSKIPVREALKRLEAEGLVAFHRNRGAVVTSLSEPEIVQIFEVRSILESSAMLLSVPTLTDETLSRAQGYCDAFTKETNVARWAELNWQFHSSLYDPGRFFLLGLIRSVNDRIERYLRVQLSLSHGHEVADREHRQILEACRKRDAERASELVRAHIMQACNSLMAHIPPTAPR